MRSYLCEVVSYSIDIRFTLKLNLIQINYFAFMHYSFIGQQSHSPNRGCSMSSSLYHSRAMKRPDVQPKMNIRRPQKYRADGVITHERQAGDC